MKTKSRSGVRTEARFPAAARAAYRATIAPDAMHVSQDGRGIVGAPIGSCCTGVAKAVGVVAANGFPFRG